MKIKLNITKFDPGKEKEPYLKAYEVEYEEGMRLLHAFEHIQKEKDSTLSYRWNCGSGRCGSCAVEVNGKPSLACKYEIPKGATEITVKPLKVFPAVKDLVVDLTPMRDGLKSMQPFKSKQKPFFKMYDYDIEIAKEMKKCIECGICQDVCHVLREHKTDYAGPRFMAKISSREMHPYGSNQNSATAEKSGIGYCNVTKCCQTACPEKIMITDNAIIPLKEKIAESKRINFFKKIWGWGNKK